MPDRLLLMRPCPGLLAALLAGLLFAWGPAHAEEAPAGQGGQALPASVEESRRFLEALEPQLQAYRQVLGDYNRRPGPGSPWYGREYDFGPGALPVSPTPEDQELRRLFANACSDLERFRAGHNYAFEQAEGFIKRRGGQAGAFDNLALATYLTTLGQSYNRWDESNRFLALQAKSRLGILLPRPVPPPYLQRLRGYIRQSPTKKPGGGP